MSLLAGDRAADLGRALLARLEERGARPPEVALVLGSGLGAFADTLENAVVIAFDELEDMPRSSVPGHAGCFVAGELDGLPVLCQKGRVHLYEGWPVEAVTRAVRAFSVLGVRSLILTNAAGGLVPGWSIPGLMRIEDHINMQGVSPLQESQRSLGCPYSDRLGRLIDEAALDAGVTLQRGVYAGLPGPSYETAAEIRMLRSIGAHAVGMSTVQEAAAAWAAGIEVAAVSCITNSGAGIAPAPLDHAEVVEAGEAVAGDFARLLCGAVARVRL